MHVQTTSLEHTTFKHKASVEPPLKNLKLFGNVLEDLNNKLINPTSPTMNMSSKLINYSYLPLISNNSQLQLGVDMPNNIFISS